MSSTAFLQAELCCCCSYKRLQDYDLESLSDRDVGIAKRHTSNQLILCQCESSLHMAETSSTAFEQVFQTVVFLSHDSFIIFYITVCESDPVSAFLPHSLTHTHKHSRYCFISLISYRTNIVLVSGIYQGEMY